MKHHEFLVSVRKLWRALDEDGGGSIERDEWEGALDKVGYFGPSGPIFSCWDSKREAFEVMDL